MAAWPSASRRWLLPVPDGPQTTRFSWRSIHSRVRSDRWVGAGIDDTVSSQRVEGLAGREPGGCAADVDRGRVAAGELFGEQGPDRFGWVPALRFGGGQHVGGVCGACAAAAAGAAGRRPRRSVRSWRSCGRPSRSCAHALVEGCIEWSSSARSSSPRGCAARIDARSPSANRSKRGGVTERPVDAVRRRAVGPADGFGHLHLHPRRARRGGLDQPQPGARRRVPRNAASAALAAWVAGRARPAGVAGSGRRRCSGAPASSGRWRATSTAPRRRARGWRRSRRRRHGPTPSRRPGCAGPSR